MIVQTFKQRDRKGEITIPAPCAPKGTDPIWKLKAAQQIITLLHEYITQENKAEMYKKVRR